MGPKPGWTKCKLARGRKPNYVPEERIQEEKDMLEPIGEKPWPLRLAIPAMLKRIGKIYMWGCTGGVSMMAIVYIYVQWIIGG